MVEPNNYMPVIPLVLVNGAAGIGTGWSTNIPSYNPRDIIDYIKNKIHERESIKLKPWYKHYKGTVN